MGCIIVASTRPYSGKTGVCLALTGLMEERGASVGYLKPYGTMPVEVEGVVTDEDAAFLNASLREPAPVDLICPVVRSRAFIEDLLAGRAVAGPAEVRTALDRLSGMRDVMVIEGPSDVEQGMAAGLSLCDLSDAVRARVLIVEAVEGLRLPDALLHARECLGDRLAGVVFNRVRDADAGPLREHVIPYLERRGIATFGTMPHDASLSAVTVAEIVEDLHGTVLCAEDRLEEPVVSFMVGAMGQEKALRFFRRKSRKAVITGGDRADVQLAALETSTAALILTGNMPPSPIVLARADELGVPMVLVDTDTLTAVERMEMLMGQVRLHGRDKVGRIREMFSHGVDTAALLAAFDLP